jgi:hypothetical protein
MSYILAFLITGLIFFILRLFYWVVVFKYEANSTNKKLHILEEEIMALKRGVYSINPDLVTKNALDVELPPDKFYVSWTAKRFLYRG